MYKVFINDKPLYFYSQKAVPEFLAKKVFTLEYKSGKDFQTIVEILSEDSDFKTGIIFSDDGNALFKKFCNLFTIIEAAGGVVFNKKKELLMIYRLEKWDLPKGKIEKNELPDAAALREVCEETGVCDCEIISELHSTYHIYTQKKKNILKKTFWFEMKCKTFSGFKLQDEEGITDAKWMSEKKIETVLDETYQSLWELIS